MRKIDKVIIHSSATYFYMDIGVSEIDSWHRQRGFRCIGYHFVIRRNGIVEYGRPINETGAHAKGYNKNSIGICWIGGIGDGNIATDNRTDEQKDSLIVLLKSLKLVLSDKFNIIGHKNVKNTDCPSFDARGEYLFISE